MAASSPHATCHRRDRSEWLNSAEDASSTNEEDEDEDEGKVTVVIDDKPAAPFAPFSAAVADNDDDDGALSEGPGICAALASAFSMMKKPARVSTRPGNASDESMGGAGISFPAVVNNAREDEDDEEELEEPPCAASREVPSGLSFCLSAATRSA